MNQFELFCMIFYVLDAAWDETKDPELGNFLSGANPFLFSDIAFQSTLSAYFSKSVSVHSRSSDRYFHASSVNI